MIELEDRALEAWCRGYGLIAQLVLRGVRPEDLPSLAHFPQIWSALPTRVDEGEAWIDLERIAADHYALFERTVYPYRGVFLSPQALILGEEDHLGASIQTLAQLCLRRDARGASAHLRDRLLPWLAPVSCSLMQRGGPLFSAVVELLLSVVERHASGDAVPEPALPPPWSLDEQDGLQALVKQLLAPALAGGLLTHEDLRELAQALGLPKGFGERRLVLSNLFRAAADFDRTRELLEQLARCFERFETQYAGWIAEHPAIADAARPWSARAQHTAHSLREIAERLP